MEIININKIQNSQLNFILTMETSIKGGSVSLFLDGKLLDFHVGNKSVSSSEDLLPKIFELLKRNDISKSEIETIVISNGPGSFTGIRIGIATAFGLQKSLNCKCYGVDLLKTLALKGSFESNSKSIISALSHGRNKICWYDFDVETLNSSNSETDYFVSDLDLLTKYIAEKSDTMANDEIVIVCTDSDIYNALAEKLETGSQQNLNLINTGENLSAVLGFYLLNKNTIYKKPQPLYLNETNYIS